jgi:hypothetical protein
MDPEPKQHQLRTLVQKENPQHHPCDCGDGASIRLKQQFQHIDILLVNGILHAAG